MASIMTQLLIGERQTLGRAQIDADHFPTARWWMRITQSSVRREPYPMGVRQRAVFCLAS